MTKSRARGQEVAPLLVPHSFSRSWPTRVPCVRRKLDKLEADATPKLYRLKGQSRICSVRCGFPCQSLQPAEPAAWSHCRGREKTAVTRSCSSVSTYPSLSNLARRCCCFATRTRTCLQDRFHMFATVLPCCGQECKPSS